jgi:arylsulfatase A-like enzyme
VQVDTLRADSLLAYGGTRDTMPLLFARPGWVTVERAVSTGSWTAPATASLVTGLDLPRHGIRYFDDEAPNHRLDSPTFQKYLGEQGFDTALYTGSGLLIDGAYSLGEGFAVAELVEDEPGNADAVVTAGLDWLGARDSDAPFLLFLQPMDPHGPYDPEAEDLGTWSDPANLPFDVTQRPDQQESDIFAALDAATTEEETAAILTQVRAVYDEQILGLDRELDRLFDGLAASGHLEDTLVVVTADHGESFYDGVPAMLGHGFSTRNELVHVPLFLWGANVPDTYAQCLASNMDVFPTVIDALGLEPMADVDGQSLLDACRQFAFSGVYEATAGVETIDWLGVETLDAQVMYDCTGDLHAFDLTTDPGAVTSVSTTGIPDGAAVVQALDTYSASVVTQLPDLRCQVGE